MTAPPEISSEDITRLYELSARMVEIKERTDALEAEYAQLRDEVIRINGTGYRKLPGGFPVSVSARRSFDPSRAIERLSPDQIGKILSPPRLDPKLARTKLSSDDYELCLSDVVTYNVRLG